ncbi:MAG: TRAP transporter small permease [Oceanisphaera sp.]|uniref:TRAP transporter small permease n=1 Tax=Oceanisphaera sp. TaxID=1929979 RepID=UPI003C727197
MHRLVVMITKTIRLLSRVSEILAGLLIASNLAVLLYGVAARYLAGRSPIWMDELSRFLIIGTVLLTAGVVWIRNEHMRINLLEQKLPPKWASALKLYQWLLTVVISAAFAWYSWHYAFSVGRFTTMGLGISRTWPMLSMPLGFFMLFLFAILRGPFERKDLQL